MGFDRERYDRIKAAFALDDEALRKIADDFRADMRAGLAGEDGATLRMLRSYAGLPSSRENGSFLALDFGGTNVRALRILLKGNGDYEVLSKVAKPLTLPGVYDYVSADATAEEMFDFLAEIIDEAIEGNRMTKYLLGHTFSFPSQQTDLYNASLIVWTKEFATKGVEGKIVNDLLKDALARRGMTNVTPVAVINDTVAVLLAAAYRQEHTYIGSIYATGQNTCYYEEFADGSETATVINMESGGFGHLPFSVYDDIIDASSEQPGAQRLEKMTSGRYLGTLFGTALADLLEQDGAYPFTSIELSEIVADAYLDRHVAGALLEAKTGMTFNAAERTLLQELAAAVIIRSARIVAATYAGIIRHRSGENPLENQYIALDGSVYEKMPLVAHHLRAALDTLLENDAVNVQIILENAGSALGAALAAAMTEAK
ncbi:hexokinase [Selenomonas sp. TAMA-11512]|uniref:hexokinase n=1 Tax=Selenomonas sp. TAMA-11512 TaxID=3095337 RepID=UPI003086E5A4|nr:hexokinase [Selenomonas sp. TAMA-11512]